LRGQDYGGEESLSMQKEKGSSRQSRKGQKERKGLQKEYQVDILWPEVKKLPNCIKNLGGGGKGMKTLGRIRPKEKGKVVVTLIKEKED